jgi:hypothetical protein
MYFCWHNKLLPEFTTGIKIEMITHYLYLGDRSTSLQLKGRHCTSVLNERGKCIRGKNGNMLVNFEGRKTVVLARLLRKIKP